MTKLKVLLILLSLSSAINSTAQQSAAAIIIDGAKLYIVRDSCEVRLSETIVDKDYWFHMLKDDTILLSFFKARMNHKPIYVYIASIVRISGQLSQYEFMIYSRPVNLTAKELLSFGYATYTVTLIPVLNGKRIIGEIRFNGIII